ncbi:hypothetical protein CYMTET_19725 [Cymbomonas tetramitiformis]|uniref:Uncharacterized protein n=1 Tax=Cymbomonas tetramitiformis TaxID=36881 RepID=A0AAE0L4Y5_9CHLO|nr:hypothetical protein CYMTET_19725 [Cymbomonas tetramitiformis]
MSLLAVRKMAAAPVGVAAKASTATTAAKFQVSSSFQAPSFAMRPFCSVSAYSAEIDAINDKFAEARDEIEMATEDAETVYFNESAETAREVTNECITLWKQLLEKVSPETKVQLQRSMGLKLEQLKEEVKLLDHLHDDH